MMNQMPEARMRKQDDATADMAALSIKGYPGVGEGDAVDSGVNLGVVADNESDLSDRSDESEVPPPPMKTTIFRKKKSDPSHMAKLGVNMLTYYPSGNVFIAHPVDLPTTPALVAKVPVPADGKGMSRPEIQTDRKGVYKVVVLLRDHSQEANLRKLNLEEDVCKLVENGRRRCFFFLFKNKWEADLFSDLYHQASFPVAEKLLVASDADASDEEDDADDFEASQDVFQIVRNHTKEKRSNVGEIQPSIKEGNDEDE